MKPRAHVSLYALSLLLGGVLWFSLNGFHKENELTGHFTRIAQIELSKIEEANRNLENSLIHEEKYLVSNEYDTPKIHQSGAVVEPYAIVSHWLKSGVYKLKDPKHSLILHIDGELFPSFGEVFDLPAEQLADLKRKLHGLAGQAVQEIISSSKVLKFSERSVTIETTASAELPRIQLQMHNVVEEVLGKERFEFFTLLRSRGVDTSREGLWRYYAFLPTAQLTVSNISASDGVPQFSIKFSAKTRETNIKAIDTDGLRGVIGPYRELLTKLQ